MLRYLKIILLLSLFSFSNWAFAVTDFDCTIGRTGEDYSTIASYESAMDDASDLTLSTTNVFSHSGIVGAVADAATVTGSVSGATATVVHATATQIFVYSDTGLQSGENFEVDGSNYVTSTDSGDSVNPFLYVYDDNGYISAYSGTDFNGLVTSATNHWNISAIEEERGDGKNYNGARIRSTNNSLPTLTLTDDCTEISWVGVFHWAQSSPSDYYDILLVGDDSVIRNCVLTSLSATTAGCGGIGSALDVSAIIMNNLFYKFYKNGIVLKTANSTKVVQILNNTFERVGIPNSSYFGVGIKLADLTNSHIVKNNLVIGSTYADYAIGNATASNNGSSDTSGSTNLRSLTTAEFISVTDGAEDYHLASDAKSIDAGADLGTTPTGINLDIVGTLRPQGDAWDIGANELIVEPVTTTKSSNWFFMFDNVMTLFFVRF